MENWQTSGMMAIMNAKLKLICTLLCLMVVLGCNAPLWTPTPTPLPTATPLPTFTPVPTMPPTATPVPEDTGWQAVTAGIKVRSLNVTLGENVERVTITRLAPDVMRFRVLYTPGQTQFVSEWAQQASTAVVVNAGYFTPEYIATGLLISNGEPHGVSYEDYAGMLTVDNDGTVSLRWLRDKPYNPDEPLREAVQCFPVLVKPGGVMGFPADADDGRAARRAVVAQDRAGRILFLVAPRGYFSLHELAVWLTESDLDVDIAMNLDGGPSSGLWVKDGPQVDSLGGIPAVIVVDTNNE